MSKKLPGIRLIPVELEFGRKAPAEFAQALQQLSAAGLARDGELTRVGGMDFDLVALFQRESLETRSGRGVLR